MDDGQLYQEVVQGMFVHMFLEYVCTYDLFTS